MTNKNLEQEFVLVDILWIIYYILNLLIKGCVKVGLKLNITTWHWYQHTPQLKKKMKQPKKKFMLFGKGMWFSSQLQQKNNTGRLQH